MKLDNSIVTSVLTADTAWWMSTHKPFDDAPDRSTDTDFVHGYEQVKAVDYQNAYIHGKLKAAPDRQHKTGVHIRVEEEYAEISTLVQDKEGNEVNRIPLMRTLPHYMFIYKFIHSRKWLDKKRFKISDKSGQVVFGVDIAGEKAEMGLHPSKQTALPELLHEVKWALAEG